MEFNETKMKSEGKREIILGDDLFYVPSSPGEIPYLKASKCDSCGLVTFPKLKVCPRCTKRNLSEIALSGKGVIDTFAVVNSALPGFKSPSIQGYVRLNEGPRIWTLITGCEPDEVEIGMEVELVIGEVRTDAEGNSYISYQFKPMKRSQK